MSTDSDATVTSGRPAWAASFREPTAPNQQDIDLVVVGLFISVIDLIQFSANGYVEAFMIGSYHFYFNDLAVAILGIALLRRVSSFVRLRPIGYFSIIYGCVIALDLLRGTAVNAFQAFMSYRYFVELPIFLVLFTILKQSRHTMERYLPVFLFGTAMLLGLFALRLVFGQNLFIRELYSEILSAQGLEDRYINADAAMFLGCCGILYLHIALAAVDRQRRTFFAIIAAITLFALLATRQRTATLATIASLAVYFICDPDLRRRVPIWFKLSIACAVGLVSVLLLVGMGDQLKDFIPQTFQESASSTGTFMARLSFWSAAWQEFRTRDLFNQIFGDYAGHPTLLVTATGQIWQTSLHNQYIQTLNNFGVAGLIGFSLILVSTIVSVVRANIQNSGANAAGVAPPVGAAWITAILVFGFSYEWVGVLPLFYTLACAPWMSRSEEPAKFPFKAL